ncbi:uncharacterized protein LOC112456445 [Temnothorax curvispinosus]|uniref:Uncharacterized protein LOC112456445 n=1 Tax=Temnothorax curvispinosus TaxID=300111 RepID=A0A6J1PY06_9HYME|nr:uncharacterized protein LOC112456445 [Temnothorax curvispinosus]
MLAEVSKLFDPLGLVGPIITAAKILIQSLWACNVWLGRFGAHEDSQGLVSDKIPTTPLEFIEIPRLVISKNPDSGIQLHGFCDASEQAYGACIYVREDGVLTALLCSKSRVAPLKTLSLPRLKLCAAVLLIRLMNKVASILNVRVYKRRYWTDSQIILAWLSSPARRWKTFVSNRVSEIQDGSSPSAWHHIKSKENPADLISRGATPEKLKGSTLWWEGPRWLRLSENEWPAEGAELSSKTVLEERVEVLMAETSLQEAIIPYYQYSLLGKLLRVIAYILRFCYNSRYGVKNRKTGCISASKINKARVALIRITQAQEFEKEIKLLRCHESVPRGSRLYSLNPYLDNCEILRVGGRLENAQLPEATKHPIILPIDAPRRETDHQRQASKIVLRGRSSDANLNKGRVLASRCKKRDQEKHSELREMCQGVARTVSANYGLAPEGSGYSC